MKYQELKDFADSLISLSEEEAASRVKEAGREFRVTMRDSEKFLFPIEINTHIINVVIKDGKVISSSIG